MLIESTSDLIADLTVRQMPSGIWVQEAALVNGNALVIAADTLALYRRPGSCTDLLGNGFIRSIAIPESSQLQAAENQPGQYIAEHRAGYVGLHDGRVLLITLNDVQMFADKLSALQNKNEIVRLSLASS